MLTTRMKLLRSIIPAAGLLGLSLRGLLYATAIDHKGLIQSGHWATWSILALTGAVLVFLLAATRKPDNRAEYRPAPVLQGSGALTCAVVVFLRAFSGWLGAFDILDRTAALSGFAAALVLLAVGVCHFFGRKPGFLLFCALSVYFALQMVSQYRHWSPEPQLMNYCFYLAAFICLMLCAYFQASFQVNGGRSRGLWFFSMAAVYFCCLAIPESGDGLFLTVCAIWAFTCPPRCAPASQEDNRNDHS